MPECPRRAILMKAQEQPTWQEAEQWNPALRSPVTRPLTAMNPLHDWRVTQLTSLGIPGLLAGGAASHVDWHEIARLARPDG